MSEYLNKIVYLSQDQYDTLMASTNNPKTITVDGITHTYDASSLYITSNKGDADTVNGHTVNIDVPYNAIFTDRYHTTGTWDDITYTATSVNGANPLTFTLPTDNRYYKLDGSNTGSKLSITHTANNSKELEFKYSTTIDYWWGVGTANVNHGLYDEKASGSTKWILSAGSDNVWTFVGNVTGNVSGSSGSCTGNAETATTATNLSAAPTITQAGSSGTTLSEATFYTLTVGGQTVVFKTPADTKNSAYGNINTSGQIGQTTNWALANGDVLVVADSSNSWKLERTGITFDASTETECLTKKGTWKAFNNYSLPTAKNDTLGGVKPWYSHTVASTGPTTGSNATAVAVNAIQTTAGRYYAVESDSNGRLFVNVPWTNVNSSYLTSHNNLVTQNVKTDNKKYGIILSNYETSASTTTAAAVNRDSKVYVNPSLNSVNAGQFVLHDKAATPIERAYMVWNATDQSIDFVFN